MPTSSPTPITAAAAAYNHSLDTLLDLPPDSNVHKALQANGLDEFSLLANIEADDLEDLSVTITDSPPTSGTLNLGQKKTILLLKWFYVIHWQQALPMVTSFQHLHGCSSLLRSLPPSSINMVLKSRDP